ncbi:efflux RND transporter periplasmic adaptor subunit [Paenibacillus sp. B01]|nr:efflux RND transporter periplasmic adaptor subunit [Paenibacillus sp. B01]
MVELIRKRPVKPAKPERSPRQRIAALGLLSALVLSGCSLLPVEETTLQPPLVQPAEEALDLVEAARGSIQTSLKGNATFVSADTKALSFKDAGTLRSIAVKLGQQVKAGELLAELETGDLELQTRLQRLNVERAELLYSQARASQASSTDLRLREIDLERERLSLEAMEERLGKSKLLAPIAGTIIFAETLQTGDRVNGYQPILTVADQADMQLTYSASSSKDVAAVETGMPVSLTYKGKSYTGKVLQAPGNVPAGTDPAKAEKNAVTLYIGIDDPPAGIQVGHSAQLEIQLQKRDNAIVLPRAALRTYMNRFYVQVAEGERRKEVDVEVGLMTPTEVEIVKGLQDGQQVILNN